MYDNEMHESNSEGGVVLSFNTIFQTSIANFLILTAVVLFALYIGKVIGLYILCDSINELNIAKRLVFLMPILSIRYIFRILSGKSGIDGSRFQALRFYFCINSNIVIAHACADFLKEQNRTVVVYKDEHLIQSIHVMKNGFSVALTNILSNMYSAI